MPGFKSIDTPLPLDLSCIKVTRGVGGDMSKNSTPLLAEEN